MTSEAAYRRWENGTVGCGVADRASDVFDKRFPPSFVSAVTARGMPRSYYICTRINSSGNIMVVVGIELEISLKSHSFN